VPGAYVDTRRARPMASQKPDCTEPRPTVSAMEIWLWRLPQVGNSRSRPLLPMANAMSVASEIRQHLTRASERTFDVDAHSRLAQVSEVIITTANEFTSDTHDRMPVVVEEGAFAPWLGGAGATELLRPAANDVR
jgi:hypothetical protein